MSPRPLVHPLHQALLSAQDKIEKLSCENITLKEENATLTLRELRTSEALEELTSLYNQAKKEKEETEARIKKMEEDFQEEKKSFQDLNGDHVAEISSFRTECNRMEEEELSESKKELYQGRRQMEREITSLKERLHIQQEETAFRLSSMEDHWREVIQVREENAATKLRESEEKWQWRVSQLEEEVREKSSLVSSLNDKMMTVMEEERNTMTLMIQNQSEFFQSKENWESKCNALKERLRQELTEKEESWQRRMQEEEERNELGKMWLQKEAEWRQKTSALEEEINCLTNENYRLQELTGYRKEKTKAVVEETPQI